MPAGTNSTPRLNRRALPQAADGRHFVLSNEPGRLRSLPAADLRVQASLAVDTRPWMWDNHLRSCCAARKG